MSLVAIGQGESVHRGTLVYADGHFDPNQGENPFGSTNGHELLWHSTRKGFAAAVVRLRLGDPSQVACSQLLRNENIESSLPAERFGRVKASLEELESSYNDFGLEGDLKYFVLRESISRV
jgi:hypothetical protein